MSSRGDGEAAPASSSLERARIEAFEELVTQRGWNYYQELVASHIERQASELLEPAHSLDGLVETEYQKGMMRGFILCRDLVRAAIASFREIHPKRSEENEP